MIKLQRLKDVTIKGNFTIKCTKSCEIFRLHDFFKSYKNNIKFKDIKNVPSQPNIDVRISLDEQFIIKYESLAELLKLREICQIRANKFDMKLIEKRGYDPFTPEFYKSCENTDIVKVRK